MANVLKHRFTSAKSDGADATQVQPSHWNDGHAFTGGAAGDVLTRDPTDAAFGATWQTRKTVVLAAGSGASTTPAPTVLANVTMPTPGLALTDALAITVSVSMGGTPGPLPLTLYGDAAGTGNTLVALTGASGGGDLSAAAPVGQFHVLIRAHAGDFNYVHVSGFGGTAATFTQVRAFTFYTFAGPMGGFVAPWTLSLVQGDAIPGGGALNWSWIVHRIG